jgi:hypothetical protein
MPLDAVLELDHLAGLDVVEAVDAGDAVADRQHGADFGDLGLGAEAGDLVADDLGDFCGADVHKRNMGHAKRGAAGAPNGSRGLLAGSPK